MQHKYLTDLENAVKYILQFKVTDNFIWGGSHFNGFSESNPINFDFDNIALYTAVEINKELETKISDAERTAYLKRFFTGLFSNDFLYHLNANAKDDKDFAEFANDFKKTLQSVLYNLSELCIEYENVNLAEVLKQTISNPDLLPYTIIGKDLKTISDKKKNSTPEDTYTLGTNWKDYLVIPFQSKTFEEQERKFKCSFNAKDPLTVAAFIDLMQMEKEIKIKHGKISKRVAIGKSFAKLRYGVIIETQLNSGRQKAESRQKIKNEIKEKIKDKLLLY